MANVLAPGEAEADLLSKGNAELGAAAKPPAAAPTPLPPLVGEGLGTLQRLTGEALANRQTLNQQMRDVAAARGEAAQPYLEQITQESSTPPGAPPKAPTLPPAPVREFRPFLAGTPGNDPYQSLQKAMGGLALIATQAKGAFGNYPQGALASLSGALTGWAQGDQRRGDAEFQTYREATANAIQQWNMARQEFADTLAARHARVEDLSNALRATMMKYNMPAEMLQLADRNIEQAMAVMGDWGKTLIQTGWHADHAAFERDLAASKDRLAQAQQDATNAWRMAQDQRMRDQMAQTAAQHAATLAETQRHHLATEARADAAANAGANKVLGSEAAKWENGQGQRPPATYTIAEATAAGFHPSAKASTGDSARMLQHAMSQVENLIPALEKKGLLATGPGGASMLMAGAQRHVIKPGDPDLGAFLFHSGTMVSALRGLGDIGPRAMAAYGGAVNLIDKVQTADAVRRGVGQIRNLLSVIAPSDIERTVRVKRLGPDGKPLLQPNGQPIMGTLKLAPGESLREIPDGMELD